MNKGSLATHGLDLSNSIINNSSGLGYARERAGHLLDSIEATLMLDALTMAVWRSRPNGQRSYTRTDYLPLKFERHQIAL